MLKRLVIAAAFLILGGISFVALNSGTVRIPFPEKSAATAQTPPRQNAEARRRPAPVEVAQATRSMSATEIMAVGSLMSDESVEVTSEVAGRVMEILFEEGKQVKAGEVLVKLDDSLPLAELKDAEARLALAEATYERSRSLQKSGAVAEQAFEEARTNLEVARAAVELARTREQMMQVKAPFDGILGFRTVSVGAYVTAGTKLVNLEKVDTLKVEFSVPEVFLAQLAPGQKVVVTVDAYPGASFEGTIYALNPHVDINGRAIQVRATIKNEEMTLRPGLLARVVVKGTEEREVVMVPESAIVPRGGEILVYRLEDGKAIETLVTIGRRRNGLVEVLDGLEADAKVVTAGHTRLRDGSEVEIVTPAGSSGG